MEEPGLDLEIERGTNTNAGISTGVTTTDETETTAVSPLAPFADPRTEPIELEDDKATEAEAAVARLSANTMRAYVHGWDRFVSWCTERNVDALPSSGQTVATFVAECQADGLSASTVKQRISAISFVHELWRLPSPAGTKAVRTAVMSVPTAEPRATPVITPQMLEAMVRTVRGTPSTMLSDQALLSFMFWTGLKPYRIGEIQLKGVTVDRTAETIAIAGHDAVIDRKTMTAADPYARVSRWLMQLSMRGVTTGPLFMAIDRHGNFSLEGISPSAVAAIVKRAVAAIGENPERYTTQSLRAQIERRSA